MGRTGNKFGWHSGVLTCKDAKIRGDIYIQDDIVFSDVSAGVLGVTGGIDMTGTTSAVGIDMSGGTFATAELRLGNAATFDNSSNGLVLCTEPTWNFRATTGFIHSYDGSNYLTSTVASNGVCKLATTGSADSFEIETGDGKIIFDAKTDIDLDPEGNDIHLLGSAAGKITLASTSVTLYGGDTAADSLVLRGSSAAATEAITLLDGTSVTVLGTSVVLDGNTTVDGDHTFGTGTGAVSLNGDTTVAAGKTLYIRDASQSIASASDDLMTLTSPTLTLAGATKINLDGPLDVTGILTVDTAGSPADGIKINATTPTDGLEIASACGSHAINISGAQTGAGITVANSCGTYGLNIAGACTDAGIYVSGTFASGGALNVGTFASPITMYNTSDKPTVMISGDVLADQASGIVKGLWVRSKISKEQGAVSVMGVEAQCRVNGAASAAATLGAGQFTGIWAYWEQSGTTALNTGALASGASCTVESAATLTVDAGAILAGVVVDSSVNDSATINGTFDGIYIKKASGAKDFVSGIEMTDCISSEVFKFADDGSICADAGDKGSTAGGFYAVKVGSATRYVNLVTGA